MKIGSNASRLLKYAINFYGNGEWHSYAKGNATIQSLRRLAEEGFVELDKINRKFRLARELPGFNKEELRAEIKNGLFVTGICVNAGSDRNGNLRRLFLVYKLDGMIDSAYREKWELKERYPEIEVCSELSITPAEYRHLKNRYCPK